MESLLRIAEELERRDEELAAALAEVEELRREVEELRVHVGVAADFLATLPARLAERRLDEQTAADARAVATAALDRAEAELARARERGKEDALLAAERALQRARDELREAELHAEQATAERARLEREGQERTAEAERLAARARELGDRLAADPRLATGLPATGLDGALEWASRARGALLVAGAGLAAERDKIVREASELAAAALGEPLATGGVAAVRQRLARSLDAE